METKVENAAKIAALNNLRGDPWKDTTSFLTLGECLASINLLTTNSGWYKPQSVQIPGVGEFMLNPDGSVFCEYRIIQNDGLYLIQEMTTDGWSRFEELVRHYFEILLSE